MNYHCYNNYYYLLVLLGLLEVKVMLAMTKNAVDLNLLLNQKYPFKIHSLDLVYLFTYLNEPIFPLFLKHGQKDAQSNI